MDAWIGPLIVTLVPVLVAGIKKLVGPATWLLPLLAGLLGVLADLAAAYVMHRPVSPAWGLALGMAGVGLREAVDQLKQAAK